MSTPFTRLPEGESNKGGGNGGLDLWLVACGLAACGLRSCVFNAQAYACVVVLVRQPLPGVDVLLLSLQQIQPAETPPWALRCPVLGACVRSRVSAHLCVCTRACACACACVHVRVCAFSF